jgi:hypothetical protein
MPKDVARKSATAGGSTRLNGAIIGERALAIIRGPGSVLAVGTFAGRFTVLATIRKTLIDLSDIHALP